MSDAPDIAGEVYGWRAWYVESRWPNREPRLVSLNGARWPTDAWLVAECGGREGDLPHEYCHGCGIHAAKDRSQLVGFGYTLEDGPMAIGVVGLAGRIIPGSMGWRAARGRPVRLWVPHTQWELVRPLREAYGVPVSMTNITRAEDAHV